MGFRDYDDSQSEVWELVRVNRTTGEREIVRDRIPIQGRWTADAALRRATEANRDPSVAFEIQTAAATKKKFRAAAFGDETEQLRVYKDPNDSGRFRS